MVWDSANLVGGREIRAFDCTDRTVQVVAIGALDRSQKDLVSKRLYSSFMVGVVNLTTKPVLNEECTYFLGVEEKIKVWHEDCFKG